uniref:Exportin-T n=1 Tax=Chromera velia CCMP2878 TaxID=1169474 RepID=A0A0G4HD97_9ALVE|eukprot:Cvel_6406.t1-p1 / transcript=Cvel_6406.t1 / gene=Cvel_6406 / organism=Chromera_velia_CCMP2878 / gene_product=Exportin-T, putative / transcript_product=Exportin-T, putative / location=Cvel_scaffold313:25111-33205(+) / protein_length=1133 / sequence_SO=supercontig / SO=protein_coding / is_pseudo=false
MDEFEKAVMCLFQGQMVREATEYCEGIKAAPDGWNRCLQSLLTREGFQVRFWCLMALLEIIQARRAPPEGLGSIRDGLGQYLDDHLVRHADPPDLHESLRNKLCQVYVALLREIYPAGWPTCFSDLIGRLGRGQPVYLECFLRVLEEVDQQVVEDGGTREPEERARNTAIKDEMRMRDLPTIIDTLFQILSAKPLLDSQPLTVARALTALAKLVTWSDASLIASTERLQCVFALLLLAHAPCAAGAASVVEALLSKGMSCSAKFELIEQFRIADAVIQFLPSDRNGVAGLDVDRAKVHASLCNALGQTALDVFSKMRAWKGGEELNVSALGGPHHGPLAPTPAPPVSQEQGRQLALKARSIVVRLTLPAILLFEHSDLSVSLFIEPFIVNFVTNAKPPPKSANSGVNLPPVEMEKPMVCSVAAELLRVCLQKSSLPPEFLFEEAETEDASEDQYEALQHRKEVLKLFRRVLQLDEETGLGFLGRMASDLCPAAAQIPACNLEAALRLFVEAGELVRDTAAIFSTPGHPLTTALRALCTCEAIVGPSVVHVGVRLALQDLFIRYGAFFVNQTGQDLLAPVALASLLDGRGLRHTSRRVVANAASKLQRLTKLAPHQLAPLASQVLEAMQPLLAVEFIPSAVIQTALQEELRRGGRRGRREGRGTENFAPVIAGGKLEQAPVRPCSLIPNRNFGLDEQMLCFETIGFLLGVATEPAPLPLAERKTLLVRVLSPLLAPLLEGGTSLAEKVQSAGAENRAFADFAARLLSCVASVSKGFTPSSAGAFLDEWREAARAVEESLKTMGWDEKIRVSGLLLLRRWMDLFGSGALAFVTSFVPIIFGVENLRNVELQEMAIFLHHFVSQYKQEAEPFLREQFPRCALRLYQAWKQVDVNRAAEGLPVANGSTEPSQEAVRERNEMINPLLQCLHGIASTLPMALVALLAEGQGQASPETTAVLWEVIMTPIAGAQSAALGPYINNVLGFGYSLQIWQRLLGFGLKTGEQVLFALKTQETLPRLLTACLYLDVEDAQQYRLLNDYCHLFRLLLSPSFSPNPSERSDPNSPPAQVAALTSQTLESLFVAGQASASDVQVFLQKVVSPPRPDVQPTAHIRECTTMLRALVVSRRLAEGVRSPPR